MHKQTVLDRIEVERDGTINLRFAQEVVDDDGSIIKSEPHRTVCAPGTDVDAHIVAISEHIVTHLKGAPIGADDIARVKALTPTVWTKKVKDAHAAKRAAAAAKAKAEEEADLAKIAAKAAAKASGESAA
jgi:hypothetical protein